MIMGDVDMVTDLLHQLHDLGLQDAIDDFGTGYSSLAYLKRFPLDKLKIDQSFVRDVTDNTDSAAITKAIIGLGKSLNMEFIAEGVETAAQLASLRQQGCAQGQGYYFSPPLAADDLIGCYRKTERRMNTAS